MILLCLLLEMAISLILTGTGVHFINQVCDCPIGQTTASPRRQIMHVIGLRANTSVP